MYRQMIVHRSLGWLYRDLCRSLDIPPYPFVFPCDMKGTYSRTDSCFRRKGRLSYQSRSWTCSVYTVACMLPYQPPILAPHSPQNRVPGSSFALHEGQIAGASVCSLLPHSWQNLTPSGFLKEQDGQVSDASTAA